VCILITLILFYLSRLHRERVLSQSEQRISRTISSHRQSELSILAKQWELKLYRQADSFDAYIDESTFMKRINKLGRSTNSEGEVTLMQHHRLHLLRHAMMCREEVCSVSPFCSDIKDVARHMQGCTEGANCEVPFCVTLQRLSYHSKVCRDPGCKICSPSANIPGCEFCEDDEKKKNSRSMGGSEGSQAIYSESRSVQAKLRQDYLLTMIHASLCHHDEEAQCLRSPLCFDLKKVWIHRIYCTTKDCQFPFCASNRMIVDHYNNCQDAICPVCPCVRATKAKHGMKKLTADVCLPVNKAASGVQSTMPQNATMTHSAMPQTAAKPIRDVQHAVPHSTVPPNAERPVRSQLGTPPKADMPVPDPCADPNLVAQQLAIYEQIKQKQKRKRSPSKSTDEDSAETLEAFVDGAPMAAIDSALEEFSIDGSAAERDSASKTSSSKDSAEPAAGDNRQIREYERLSRAHKQRQQGGSSVSLGSSVKSHSSSDKKPAAKIIDHKTETNYLATPFSTVGNSKQVACTNCNSDLFVPPMAVNFFCQECTYISTLKSKSSPEA